MRRKRRMQQTTIMRKQTRRIRYRNGILLLKKNKTKNFHGSEDIKFDNFAEKAMTFSAFEDRWLHRKGLCSALLQFSQCPHIRIFLL